MMMQDNYVHMKKISGNVHISKLKEKENMMLRFIYGM